jgi:hypothetical protein
MSFGLFIYSLIAFILPLCLTMSLKLYFDVKAETAAAAANNEYHFIVWLWTRQEILQQLSCGHSKQGYNQFCTWTDNFFQNNLLRRIEVIDLLNSCLKTKTKKRLFEEVFNL